MTVLFKVALVRAGDVDLDDVVRPFHRNGAGVEIAGSAWGAVERVDRVFGPKSKVVLTSRDWGHVYTLGVLELVECQVLK